MRGLLLGFVLNTASVGAYQPSPTYASYSAAKSFILTTGAVRVEAVLTDQVPGRYGVVVLVTARLRPPDRTVEVPDAHRVADLLAHLEVLPTTVLVIRDGALLTSQDELHDGDQVEVRFAISGGSGGLMQRSGSPPASGGSGGLVWRSGGG